MGTIQLRTNIRPLRPRITMQHMFSHGQNVGNECADHAAALGALGFTSNHNISARWNHTSFDATTFFF